MNVPASLETKGFAARRKDIILKDISKDVKDIRKLCFRFSLSLGGIKMRFNDISNRQAPIIAFNLDNLLYKKTAKKFLFFNYEKEEPNQIFVDTVNNVWNKNEVCIYLVTAHDYLLNADFEEFLTDELMMMYTKLIQHHGIDNLRRMIFYHFHYFIDNDEEFMSKLSCKNVIHFNNINKYMRV
jgi:hypothetical protein